ncbi:MAG: hypothetical protein A3C53_05160 [Omnitrophica WOR_2 bacterium RIFCSPHIGHO2_02_FULL_68_15]|nr:MAG: hypothetical protein A3C53_05160 [Omnitrophica WOR_2 bacterium RIFCSPHIGHO2_02_FULL_68_15]
MDDKPLSQTNPYLQDPAQYEELLILNVTSSTAVELRKVPASIVRALRAKNLPSLIKLPTR